MNHLLQELSELENYIVVSHGIQFPTQTSCIVEQRQKTVFSKEKAFFPIPKHHFFVEGF